MIRQKRKIEKNKGNEKEIRRLGKTRENGSSRGRGNGREGERKKKKLK